MKTGKNLASHDADLASHDADLASRGFKPGISEVIWHHSGSVWHHLTSSENNLTSIDENRKNPGFTRHPMRFIWHQRVFNLASVRLFGIIYGAVWHHLASSDYNLTSIDEHRINPGIS